MAERGHLFMPILIILVGLFMGYSAPLCALVGGARLPADGAAAQDHARGHHAGARVLEALEEGAKNTLSVAMACACAGIVIGCVTITGLGIVFTQIVIALAQNSLLLALILTAIAGIILGMGMPTTPAYIVMVSLLVPALIKLGAVAPAAHMFAFYFAILSAITPPVALAVFAAASLAKADIWTTGWAAMRAAAPAYIVPFMFVYEPTLLLIVKDWASEWPFVVWSIITATVGVICLAGEPVRLPAGPRLDVAARLLLVVAALCLIKPGLITDVIGLALLALVAVAQVAAGRRAAG